MSEKISKEDETLEKASITSENDDRNNRIQNKQYEKYQFEIHNLESLNNKDNYSLYDDVGFNINKLGDNRDFGNFYELVQNRKLKVFNFLQKDICQISAPDLRPFVNINHAYECLLPYHVFYPYLYEDHVFFNTDDTYDFKGSLLECIKSFDDIQNQPLVEEHGIAAELLLFYEQRYLKMNKDDTIEGNQSSLYHKSVKQSSKKRNLLNKRNTIFRLKVNETVGVENGIRISNYKYIFKNPE